MTNRTVLLWAHPVAGLAVVGLMVRVARWGVGGRQASAVGARARTAHRAWTPRLLAVVVVEWAGGVATVWLGRDDLTVASSAHFGAGSAIVLLLLAAAAVSRWIGSTALARQIHPWLGAVAVLLAGVQVFLGLQLMPR